MVDSPKCPWFPPPGRLRTAIAFAIVISAIRVAEAQEPGRPAAPIFYQSRAYATVGIGPSPCTSSAHLHAAIGAEGLVAGGFGVGGEVGMMADGNLSHCAAPVVSLNALYRLARPTGPGWSPFVTGGGSMLIAEGGGVGGNVAVGIVRFTRGRVAFRFEARAHWFPEENGFVEVRLGVSF